MGFGYLLKESVVLNNGFLYYQVIFGTIAYDKIQGISNLLCAVVHGNLLIQ